MIVALGKMIKEDAAYSGCGNENQAGCNFESEGLWHFFVSLRIWIHDLVGLWGA